MCRVEGGGMCRVIVLSLSLMVLAACSSLVRRNQLHLVRACGSYKIKLMGYQLKPLFGNFLYFGKFEFVNKSKKSIEIYLMRRSNIPVIDSGHVDFQKKTASGWGSDVLIVGEYLAPTKFVTIRPGMSWEFYYLLDGYLRKDPNLSIPRRVVVTSNAGCKFASEAFYLERE